MSDSNKLAYSSENTRKTAENIMQNDVKIGKKYSGETDTKIMHVEPKNHIEVQVKYNKQVSVITVAKRKRNAQSKQNNGSELNIVEFKCQRCVKVFKSMSELSAHNVIHQKAALYRCKKCDSGFSHLSLLKRHFVQEHRSHSCFKCGLTFAKREMLSLHKYQMHTNKDYPCGDCGRVYSTVGNLRSHMFSQHRKSFWCEQCGNDFTCQVDLEKHLATIHSKNHEMRSFECGKCSKYFASQSLLNKHIETHTKRFDCPDCEKSCKTEWNLEQHRRIHEKGQEGRELHKKKQEGRGIEKVNCKNELCIQNLGCIKDLKKHKLRIHTDQKPIEFKCSHIGCNSAFRTQGQLYVHSNIHSRVQLDESGNSEADIGGCKQYPCLYCKERFDSFSEAQVHIKSHGELKLEPVQMNSVFSMNNRDLTSTCSATDDNLDSDTDIKPHACLQCSQSFSTESDFDAHMKTHIIDDVESISGKNSINCKIESKPFPCLQCNKCYSTTSDLEAHKKVHTDSESVKGFDGNVHLIKDVNNDMDCNETTKPFPCLACHKCFTSNSHLEIHMKTHIQLNI